MSATKLTAAERLMLTHPGGQPRRVKCRPPCPICYRSELPEPEPWTPERRERAGRAAWTARLANLSRKYPASTPFTWEEISEELKESYREVGEAAVRADEGDEG